MKPSDMTAFDVVKGVFAPLGRRANEGDLGAAIELLGAAKLLCFAVEEFRAAQPELARKLAQKLDVWPAPVARHLAAWRGLEKALDELELGKDHPDAALLVPDRKSHDLDSPYNSVALEIRDVMVRLLKSGPDHNPVVVLIRELPQLASDTFDRWWDLGWWLFLRSWDGNPFSDPRLGDKLFAATRIANREGVSVESYVGRKVKQAARVMWFSARNRQDS